MIRLMTLMLVGCCVLPVAAAEPDDYAWGWSLETRGDAPAWRVRLTPEIVGLLADESARDLAVFDADQRAMPLLRLPERRLVESVSASRSREFEARAHAAGDTAAEPQPDAPDGLSLELRQPDGTYLALRSPADASGDASDLVYEALIVGTDPAATVEAGSRASPGRRWLTTRWVADRAPDDALRCRLKSLDHPGQAGTELTLRPDFDTLPVRMRARTPVVGTPRGWHIACRGPALPQGFELNEVRLGWQTVRDHNPTDRVPLEAARRDDGAFEGRVEHPYAPRRLRVTSPAPNQLSDLRLMLRADAESEWRFHGEGAFSSLGQDAPGRLDFDLERVDQRRFDWRIESRPPLAGPVEFELEVRLEEWLFLAQGRPPWTLHAGSRKAAPRDPDALADPTLARLGPAWELPRAIAEKRFEVGGSGALEPAPSPLPWRQYLLWLVLIGSSVAVAWLALVMLRGAR